MKNCIFFILAICLSLPARANGIIPLKNFARFPEFSDIKISPKGDYLATIFVDKEGHHILAIVRIADHKVAASLLFDRRELSPYEFWWTSDTRVVTSVSDNDGTMAQPYLTGELYFLDAVSGRKGDIFGYRNGHLGSPRMNADRGPTYGHAEMVDPLVDDANNILIKVTSWIEGENQYEKVIKLNTDSGQQVRVVAQAPIQGRAYFLADHQANIRYVAVKDLENRIQTFWRGDDQAEWKQENAGELKGAVILPVAFSKDGKSVYLASTEATGRVCLVRRELGVEAQRSVLACDPISDLRKVAFSLDHQDIIAAIFEPGKPSLQLLNPDHPDAKLLASLQNSFGGDFAEITSTTRDGEKAVVHVFSDRNPGDYYLFDRKTHKAEYLFSSRSWIDPQTMSERRPISVKARDGTTLYGYLTLPQGAKPENLPLIVNPHGGPFGISNNWIWDEDAQMLASRGYAVLQLNFRGSGGYGVPYLETARHGWGTLMISDITDGAHWAVSQGIADPKRICIYGGSYGGYAALMSAVKESELYRCAVGYAGIYDLDAWRRDSDVSESKSGRAYVNEYIGESKELSAQSPITFIDQLKAAVMIVHGEEDRRVPFSQAKLLRKALDNRKYPYEWLAKAGEGHGFYSEENREQLDEKLLAFFDRHIGPNSQVSAPGVAPP